MITLTQVQSKLSRVKWARERIDETSYQNYWNNSPNLSNSQIFRILTTARVQNQMNQKMYQTFLSLSLFFPLLCYPFLSSSHCFFFSFLCIPHSTSTEIRWKRTAVSYRKSVRFQDYKYVQYITGIRLNSTFLFLPFRWWNLIRKIDSENTRYPYWPYHRCFFFIENKEAGLFIPLFLIYRSLSIVELFSNDQLDSLDSILV